MPAEQLSTDFKIRKATRKDFARIRELHEQTFREHQEREPDFKTQDTFVEQYLSRKPFVLRKIFRSCAIVTHRILVATHENQPIGYIIVARYKVLFKTDFSAVCDISIDPQLRNQGIGSRLLTKAERREAKRGAWNLHAHIYPNNIASHALFQSHGFEKGASEAQAIFAPAIFYQKNLEMPICRKIYETLKGTGFALAVLWMFMFFLT